MKSLDSVLLTTLTTDLDGKTAYKGTWSKTLNPPPLAPIGRLTFSGAGAMLWVELLAVVNPWPWAGPRAGLRPWARRLCQTTHQKTSPGKKWYHSDAKSRFPPKCRFRDMFSRVIALAGVIYISLDIPRAPGIREP